MRRFIIVSILCLCFTSKVCAEGPTGQLSPSDAVRLHCFAKGNCTEAIDGVFVLEKAMGPIQIEDAIYHFEVGTRVRFLRSEELRGVLPSALINRLRHHISKCWNPPIGARNLSDISVEIEVTMNADGTPRHASIVNPNQPEGQLFIASAESALRAVNNKNCWPYPLLDYRFDLWKTLTLHFNPQTLLGQ